MHDMQIWRVNPPPPKKNTIFLHFLNHLLYPLPLLAKQYCAIGKKQRWAKCDVTIRLKNQPPKTSEVQFSTDSVQCFCTNVPYYNVHTSLAGWLTASSQLSKVQYPSLSLYTYSVRPKPVKLYSQNQHCVLLHMLSQPSTMHVLCLKKVHPPLNTCILDMTGELMLWHHKAELINICSQNQFWIRDECEIVLRRQSSTSSTNSYHQNLFCF